MASKLGVQIEGLFKAIGRPTSEPFWPGENLSEWPEIATPLTFRPKFLENHKAQNLREFSLGLTTQQLSHKCPTFRIPGASFFEGPPLICRSAKRLSIV